MTEQQTINRHRTQQEPRKMVRKLHNSQTKEQWKEYVKRMARIPKIESEKKEIPVDFKVTMS